MALSHVVSIALLRLPHQSGCSFSSSQTWQPQIFPSLSFMVRPTSWGGGSSAEVHKTAGRGLCARKGPSAEYSAGRQLSGEESVDADQVGYRPATPRAAPQRSDGKSFRRFPDHLEGSREVTVPTEALRKGSMFKGVVASVQPFGAFVNFGAFADGLIHISKLSKGYVKNVSDIVEPGQEVFVSIVNVQKSSGRISLSLVEQKEIDRRKPYVSPKGEEEARHRGEKIHVLPGSSRLMTEREDRVSRGTNASNSISMESREDWERPQFQSRSGYIREDQGRIARNPGRISRNSYAPSRQRAPRRDWGGYNFQPGNSVGEEEEKSSWRQDEEEEEEGMSRSPFPQSRQDEKDRVSKNTFASLAQGEGREGNTRHYQQGNERKVIFEDRITRGGQEVGREAQPRPKMKFVTIRSDDDGGDKSVNNEASPPVRRMMRGWFDCECC